MIWWTGADVDRVFVFVLFPMGLTCVFVTQALFMIRSANGSLVRCALTGARLPLLLEAAVSFGIPVAVSNQVGAPSLRRVLFCCKGMLVG
jgi:hypothetical protein